MTQHDLTLYVVSVLVSMLYVGMRGFQQKNVIGRHLKSVAVTSYLIAVFEVATVTIIIKGGWLVALTSGTGAAIGMVASILLHDKLFKGKET